MASFPAATALSAGGANGWTLESAVVGGQDALDFPLDIRSSQNLAGAVVTFTDQQTTRDRHGHQSPRARRSATTH